MLKVSIGIAGKDRLLPGYYSLKFTEMDVLTASDRNVFTRKNIPL